MKRWLLLSLLLSAYAGSTQSAWPHNSKSKTGYIEFKGSLPWPASAKTSTQRQALARQWYQTRLLDSIQVIPASARQLRYLLRTHGNVTTRGHLQYQRQVHFYQLNYSLKLVPMAKGLVYYLSNFSYAEGEEDSSVEFDLEEIVKDNKADPTVLAMFRRRIAGAIAGW